MTDKERYATIGTWIEIFRKEGGVEISDATIRARLKNAGIIGKTARNRVGTVLHQAYFGESDVRRACIQLFEEMPLVNKDDILELEGVEYATISSLSRSICISYSLLVSTIREVGLEPVRGRAISNRVYSYYPVEKARDLFRGFTELPLADPDGFLFVQGVRYGVVPAFAKKFSLSTSFVYHRLKGAGLHIVRGRDNGGRPSDFYSEMDMAELLNDHLELPQADEDGFIFLDGERYGTCRSLSRFFGISNDIIARRIANSEVQTMLGRLKTGQRQSFYSETTLRNLLEVNFEDIPRVDKTGFLEIEGVQYATINGLTSLFGISNHTLAKRLGKSNVKPVFGIQNNGRLGNFYPTFEVRELFVDLIAKRKKSDDR